MADRSVAIRLATQGKATVVSDLREIGDAGDTQAKRWAKAYEAAGDQIEAGLQKQANAAAKLSAVTAQTPTQMAYQAGASTNYTGSSARDSAAAIQELLNLQDQQAARAATLKARIDPLSTAQQKYDGELKNAAELLAAGAISEAEHDAAVALSTKGLNAAKHALEEHTGALGLNRIQVITGQSALLRFTDAVVAGRSPLTAFALEAHKGVEVLSEDDGGMAGGLAKVRALLTPTTVGIAAAGVAALAAASAWYSYDASMDKLAATAQGTGAKLGESAGQLEANAEAAAHASTLTVGAARDLEIGYAGVARSGDVLVGLTAITRDFAAATGVDMKAAQQDLNKVFGDASDGAQDLAAKYGFLSEAQVENIAKLQEEGEYEKAQIALLNDLRPAIDGAAEHLTGMALAWDHIKQAADGAFNSVGAFLSKYGEKAIPAAAHAENSWFGAAAEWLLTPDGKPDGGQSSGTARGNATAAAAMGVANASTQFNTRETMAKQLGVINAALGSQAAMASMSADQIERLRTAQDQYTHATTTFLPAGEKEAQLAQINADILAARGNPARERALALQKASVENSGRLITAAQARADAEGKAEGAVTRADRIGQKHRDTLAREAEAMEVSARAALDVAEAYLKSSAAGTEAEARRKAATDATKKGIDVDAEARRELQKQVGDGLVTGGKAVAQLRDETAARDDVLAKVEAGTVGVSDMNQALQDEALLRPLISLRTYAQGSALNELNKVIDAYRAALDSAHKSEAKFGLQKAMKDSRDAVEAMEQQLSSLGKSPLIRALGQANLAANRQADDLKLTPGSPDRVNFVRQKEREAETKYQLDRQTFVQKTKDDQQDSIALTQRELELVGASDEKRQVELDKLRMSLQIKRQFPDMSQADTEATLAGVEAQDRLNAKLKLAQATMDELRQAGDQFIDDVFNPDGSGLKNLLRDVEMELLKLAAINPLKNLLLGENNPTLSSVFGKLGSLFGGGFNLDVGALEAATGAATLSATTPHNASGTEDWSGGRTWVNENGPEIADLPNGTRIYPAAQSARMMAANDNPAITLHLDASINAQGADPAALARVEAKQDQLSRSLPAMIVSAVQQARTRGMLRGVVG